LIVSSLQVETEAKPVTNQKNSGRCWIFATVNVIRIPFMKQYNLEEFEFSQAYLFFWDKVKFCVWSFNSKERCLKHGEIFWFSFLFQIERCNYFLVNMVKTAQAGDPVDGRLVSYLLHVSIMLYHSCFTWMGTWCGFDIL
jgi:bleomycin hydrolase